MQFSMTINQILVALLIIALLVMGGAMIALAKSWIGLNNNVNGLVDRTREVADETGEAVKELTFKVSEHSAEISKAMEWLMYLSLAKKAKDIIFGTRRERRLRKKRKGK